jgi:dolichol-phosphate mannosyltransferase
VPGSSNKTLSILIPCYNEVEGIPNLFKKFSEALPAIEEHWNVELIFIDDGSTDGTTDAITQHFSTLDHEVVVHPENRNLGAALRTGFSTASGDVVAILDSDCTYDPKVLVKMLVMLDDGADLVTASPYHPDGRVDGVPGYRLFLSKSLAWMLRVVMGTDNRTFSAMVRVYRREVIETVPVRHDNFVSQTQVMTEAIMKGFKVVDFPTTLAVRQFGASKMRVFSVIQAQVLFLIGLTPKAIGWRLKRQFGR